MDFLQLDQDGINVSQLVPANGSELVIPEGLSDGERKKYEAANETIRQRNRVLEIKRVEAEDDRPHLVKELERCASEMLARSKLDLLYGRYLAAGGSVDEFANEYLIPVPYHLKPNDFQVIFTLPPFLYTKPNQPLPENLANTEYAREFGRDVDIAMRVMVVITLCEKPEELEELMKRPGWNLLGLNPNQIREYVGDVGGWTKGDRSKDAIKTETRGKLTKHGNIYARGESVEQKREVEDAIVEMVGGNKAAVEIATRFFRLFVIAAEGGGERFHDGAKTSIQLEGFPETDDLTKLALTAMWQDKQEAAGHFFGPVKTKGEYKRLVVNFLKFAGYETDNQVVDGETKYRSLWEQWWGYEADGARPRENALRLGEGKWDKLNADVFRDFLLRVFIAGRKDVGLFAKLTNNSWTPDPLVNVKFWEEFKRDLNVVVNNQLITEGKFRGTKEDDVKAKVKAEKKRFLTTFREGIRHMTSVPKDKHGLILQYQLQAGYKKEFGEDALFV